jgi:hypothetical protein
VLDSPVYGGLICLPSSLLACTQALHIQTLATHGLCWREQNISCVSSEFLQQYYDYSLPEFGTLGRYRDTTSQKIRNLKYATSCKVKNMTEMIKLLNKPSKTSNTAYFNIQCAENNGRILLYTLQHDMIEKK